MTNINQQRFYVVIDIDGLVITHSAALLRGAAIDLAVECLGADWGQLLCEGYRVALLVVVPEVCKDQGLGVNHDQ